MNKKELQTLKEQLLKERKDLKAELEKIAIKDPDVEGDYDAKFPHYGGVSSDDKAQEVTEFDRRKTLENDMELRLLDIDKTLKKIEEGTYGVCDGCGKDVNPQRLKAIATVLCINCASNVKR